jgi:hypothetical protein
MLTLALCIALCGCFRTRYVNLHPPDAAPPAATTPSAQRPSGGWQSFWVFGWFPSDKVVDAIARCGGSEHVASIETRQTFLEGLVAAFAGYYINIYSPWNGRVNCNVPSPTP